MIALLGTRILTAFCSFAVVEVKLHSVIHRGLASSLTTTASVL